MDIENTVRKSAQDWLFHNTHETSQADQIDILKMLQNPCTQIRTTFLNHRRNPGCLCFF